MRDLPSGTLTFLFTDIEGSTRLLAALDERYDALQETHRELLRAAFAAHRGIEINTEGDAFFVVFEDPADAVSAAVAGQVALETYAWPEDGRIRVRMGLHTGEARVVSDDYVGIGVHEAARVNCGHGGQVVISPITRDLVGDRPIEVAGHRVGFTDLGVHLVRDFPEPIHLFQTAHPDLGDAFAVLKTLPLRRDNLPAPANAVIGRADEIAQCVALLRGDARLVTLVGPGGIGKSRLAVECAHQLVGDFDGGAWWAPLVGLSDPALIPSAIATALGGVHEQDGALLPALVERLTKSPTLLVLDNLEHLLAGTDGVETIAALLSAVPTLRVLATSRQRLRLSYERELTIGPLEVADPGAALDAMQMSDAVQLFVARATAARADFGLDADNAADVAALCQRLDGVPLAIELAAARVRLFEPKALLARLLRSLDALAGGSEDAAAHHRTLRDTIAWSYELLKPGEQALLRRLSAFAGGTCMAALESIGEGLVDDPIGAAEALVDQQLVRTRADPDGDPRFWMFATIEQYASEMLDRAGERAVAETAHADWCVDRAETAGPHLVGADQAEWLQLLDADHDNFRAALGRISDAPRALRLAGELGRFWYVRGYWAEGFDRLVRALTLPRGTPLLRARALREAGLLAQRRTQWDHAQRLLGESRDLYVEAGDTVGEINALNDLGEVARARGDFAAAGALYAEAIDKAREVGDRRLEAVVSNNLAANDIGEGRFAEARDRLQQGLALAQAGSDERVTAELIINLGLVAANVGDLVAAADRFTEALAICTRLGDGQNIVALERNLAFVAGGKGDFDTAGSHADRALEASRELGDRAAIADCLHMAGGLCLQADRFAQAWTFLREEAALRRALGQNYRWAVALVYLVDAAENLDDRPSVRSYLDELVRVTGDDQDSPVDLASIATWMLEEERHRPDPQLAVAIAKGALFALDGAEARTTARQILAELGRCGHADAAAQVEGLLSVAGV